MWIELIFKEKRGDETKLQGQKYDLIIIYLGSKMIGWLIVDGEKDKELWKHICWRTKERERERDEKIVRLNNKTDDWVEENKDDLN